ncbi:hypothetical protein MANES_02G176801v8 [Manihot esculenta]|uniref:Uncharacterized protein n=1 Tax=Manihot esculenta TaxID=3983 RepID=A0ACB7I857_MANES|nr:hypothetical protein MANES_02G176801v8 [Manihot esculenta]
MVRTSNRSLQHLYAFTMLLFSVHFNTGVGDVGIQCIERERQALLRIKHDLIDDYDVLSSWTTAEDRRDCCIWRGIACDNRTSHVTELHLHFNETADKPLRGKINHSLLELRHLTYLDLRGNNFGGTQFPADKNGSLSKLRYLDLTNANFAGTISSVLANLSSLQSLRLNLNHFHDLGNVEWLHGLSSLSYLHLSGNPLVRPSDWLQIANKLTHLKSLRLALCFSGDGIPPTLSPLNSSSSLTSINLSDNNLVIPSIHPWLSNISQNIIQLDLSHNLLQSSTPAEIGHLVSLEILNLSNTSLVGSVPKSLGNMSHLRSLHLSRNNLKMQLPDLIQNLSGSTEKSLEELYLYGNEITGPLPNFTNFSSLRIIDLHNNSLKETIDKSIGLLSKLQVLHLGLNSLHGVISEDHFLNLSNLKFLSLSGNSLVLNLSFDWVPPFSLHYIHLQSCKMGPHFPKWLQTQKYYCELDISDAEISDSIPMWFWNLSSASNRLNVSHNNLSGMVPHVSLHLYYFPTIDMSFNRLEGPLPLLLLPSRLESITRYMSSEDQRTIRTLIYLDLSNNLFSGVIPDHLMHMQDLIFLNLGNNNLSGKVPTSIGWLSNLETLNLGNNALSGELPLSLKNCSGLRFIDLSGNKLSGNIPTWIGERLISLQYLSLQSNQFHGAIVPINTCSNLGPLCKQYQWNFTTLHQEFKSYG